MAILLLVLKVLGWLLAALLILLLLALLVPVTVQLEYAKEQFTARLQVLFYTRQLWPEPPPRAKKERPHRKKRGKKATPPAASPVRESAAPPKAEPVSPPPAVHSAQPGPAAEKEQAKPSRPAPEPKKEVSVAGVPLRRILDLLPTVGAVGKRILAGLRVHSVRLYWPLQGEEAAETALRYGQFCAAWGNVTGLLQNLVRLQCDQVQPVADYLGEHTGEEHFSCKITARVFIMVAAAVYGLYRLRQLAETQSI